MATIGISYFLDGLGQIVFGSSVYSIDIGMPQDPVFILGSVFEGGLLVSQEDLTSAAIAAVLVAALAFFFQYTPTGRALRAVADDRSEEHTSELQSLMRISYAVFCLKKTKNYHETTTCGQIPNL